MQVQTALYSLGEEVKTLLRTLLTQLCLTEPLRQMRDSYPPGFTPPTANGNHNSAPDPPDLSPRERGAFLHSILQTSLSRGKLSHRASQRKSLSQEINKAHTLDAQINRALSQVIAQSNPI